MSWDGGTSLCHEMKDFEASSLAHGEVDDADPPEKPERMTRGRSSQTLQIVNARNELLSCLPARAPQIWLLLTAHCTAALPAGLPNVAVLAQIG